MCVCVSDRTREREKASGELQMSGSHSKHSFCRKLRHTVSVQTVQILSAAEQKASFNLHFLIRETLIAMQDSANSRISLCNIALEHIDVPGHLFSSN